MAGARGMHTATRLSDGRVVVFGGFDGSSSLQTTEIFDPAGGGGNGSWQSKAAGPTKHRQHTATLLADGSTVLIAGGYGASSVVGAVESYDPASNTWTSRTPMPTARRSHTATLVSGGSILMVGGYNGSAAVSTVELLVPATSTWTTKASMATARHSHTATLLPSGLVAVTGGSNTSYTASAEVYNLSANAWAPATTMFAARSSHTATLLQGGGLLVAGGSGTSPSYLASTELLDPTADNWAAASTLITARSQHTATVLQDGKILVAGGYLGTSSVGTSQTYDPASGGWSSPVSMMTPRRLHTATLLDDGKVLVTGGLNATTPLSSLELFDPGSGAWSSSSLALSSARYAHTATRLADGKVLAAGGNTGSGCTNVAQVYDPSGAGSWVGNVGTMGAPRCFHTATLLGDGRVLVTGSYSTSSFLASAELYDPSPKTWTATNGTMGSGRYHHTATLLPNGNVLVAGGHGGTSAAPTFLASAEIYDLVNETFSPTGSLSAARAEHSMTGIVGGRVLAAGGLGTSSTYLASAEIYDPGAGTWQQAASMGTPRMDFAATQLSSGAVLVTGGSNASGALATSELYTPVIADDGNACTTDTWNASLGQLTHTPVASGTACPDDGNPCTTDRCDGAGACVHAAVAPGTSCGAGLVCNSTTCVSQCYIGTAFYASETVNPGNACEACTPSMSTTAWSPCADGTACNDGNACTASDHCTSGACGGTAYTCTATSCQASSTCDGNGGCTIVNKASGVACTTDGNSCTSDACDGAGTCAHTAVAAGTGCGAGYVCHGTTCAPECFIGGVFYADGAGEAYNDCRVCAPDVSTTAWSNRKDGTACDDKNACTSNDVCTTGACGGTPYTCTPTACQAASTCDGNGGCTTVDKPTGTSCSNGNPCDGLEVCGGNGQCLAGTPPAIDDGDACTTDSCDPASGVHHQPVAVDDGNPSTIDACNPDTGAISHTSCSLDPTVATRLAEAALCYYGGANPLQTGVTANAFDPTSIAVVQGKVLERDQANPVSGVKVSIVGHTESDAVSYGHVFTRDDGAFEIVVNGGGAVTVRYEKAGYLSVDRQVQADWQHYVAAPDVAMIPLDPQVTPVTLDENTTSYQVARGSVQQDSDGTRQATVLFPPGTTATMDVPDGNGGSTAVPLTGAVSVRATEYTVGDAGPQAMPAGLPPSSAYTYAVELGVDEARAQGAVKVTFNQPVPFYVENFVGFPVGTVVPTGYYDTQKQTWVPSENGRVIKILGTDVNGLATIDSDGDQHEDDAAGLNITNDERLTLASLYAAGTTLWRARVTHFTPWDCNWPYAPPPGACGPDTSCDGKPNDPLPGDPDAPTNPCLTNGSIIECEAQILGERIPVVGTPFYLHYQSDRTPGRSGQYTIKIPLGGPNLPTTVKRIELRVAVAGRVFPYSYSCPGSCPAGLVHTFTWDGVDAFGNKPRGRQPVTIDVGYAYGVVYTAPANFDQAFGAPSTIEITGTPYRNDVTYWRRWEQLIGGGWDGRAQALGGWSLTLQHAYDPNGRTLYRGDGARRNATSIPLTVKTVAGGVYYNLYNPDLHEGGNALAEGMYLPRVLAIGPDGTIYYLDDQSAYVRRVTPDGKVYTVAGNGTIGDPTDGAIATQAPLGRDVLGMALGSDGSIYLADNYYHRIRRIFGGKTYWYASIMSPWDVAAGPDGSVFVGTGNYVLRIAPGGGSISTFAGNGAPPTGYPPQIGPATEVTLSTGWGGSRLAVATDGELYILDGGAAYAIYRVTVGGMLIPTGSDADGGSSCGYTRSFAVSPDKSVYWACTDSYLTSGAVTQVLPSGDVIRVAGDQSASPACNAYCGEGGPATKARIVPWSVVAGPDGSVYIGHWSDYARILRLAAPFPGVVSATFMVANDDGTELYYFDAWGKHQRTVDTRFNVTLYQFTYDASGRLTRITDVNGLETNIERDASGKPTAIVAPFGQRTELETADPNGYLSLVRNPNNEETSMTYYSDPKTGLLHTFTEPRGLVHTLEYDGAGYLTKDTDAANGFKQLARSSTSTGYEVTVTTAEGRVTTHDVSTLASGDEQRAHTGPDGLANTVQIGKDGTRSTHMADGTTITTQQVADPRFGVQAPVLASETTVTPGGKTRTIQRSRSVNLTDPADPLSLVSLTDATTVNGHVWTSAFTKSTSTLLATSPVGRTTTTLFDTLGRVTKVQVPGLSDVHYSYDTSGRLYQVTQDVRVWTRGYDSAGWLHTVTDPLSQVTMIDHDLAGRVTTETRPDQEWTAIGHDADGNTTTVTPPDQSAHQFTYTNADQLSTYAPPSIASEGNWPTTATWGYDLDHLLTTATSPGQGTIGYTRDLASGRLTDVTLPGTQGTIHYTYDTAGRLQSLTGPAGVDLGLGYDGSMLTSRIWSGTGYPVCSVGTTYDNDFRVSGETVNGASSVSFGYDNDGLLTSAGGMTLGRNAQNGLFTGTTLGNVTDAVGYNGFGEPTSYTAQVSGSTVYAVTYVRDDLGRIAQRTETIGSQTSTYDYAYDLAGRVLQVLKDGAEVESYVYDANGNRTAATVRGATVSGTYDEQDRLVTYGSKTYTFSHSGQLMGVVDSSSGSQWGYTYDALGNLRQVVLPNGNVIDYVVDGENHRIWKKRTGVGVVQGFVYSDALRVAAELDASGAVVARFVYGDGVNVPDAMIKGGATYRIFKDHLGSPRLVVNAATGDIAQRIDYDAFGNVLTDTSPGFQPFGFAGGLYDYETGLVRFGARDYDAETGRWTAKDPLRFSGGDANLYGYVLGDPLNYVDMLGTTGLALYDPVQSWPWRKLSSLLASIVLGVQTYYPECHIVRLSEIDNCCRKTTGYTGDDMGEDICSVHPEDRIRYANFKACQTDSWEAHGF